VNRANRALNIQQEEQAPALSALTNSVVALVFPAILLSVKAASSWSKKIEKLSPVRRGRLTVNFVKFTKCLRHSMSND
jgi:hypothetical protein